MKRIYHNHNLREDWKQGLYDRECKNIEEKIKSCIFLLNTQTVFEFYAKKVLEKWPFSCEHNLTDLGRNTNAYLGQASCCYYCGAPEFVTKIAWNELRVYQQIRANKTAESIIKNYLKVLQDKNQLILL